MGAALETSHLKAELARIVQHISTERCGPFQSWAESLDRSSPIGGSPDEEVRRAFHAVYGGEEVVAALAKAGLAKLYVDDLSRVLGGDRTKSIVESHQSGPSVSDDQHVAACRAGAKALVGAAPGRGRRLGRQSGRPYIEPLPKRQVWTWIAAIIALLVLCRYAPAVLTIAAILLVLGGAVGMR
jgi:hypothetical protein